MAGLPAGSPDTWVTENIVQFQTGYTDSA